MFSNPLKGHKGFSRQSIGIKTSGWNLSIFSEPPLIRGKK
jgi:hypothetical protein